MSQNSFCECWTDYKTNRAAQAARQALLAPPRSDDVEGGGGLGLGGWDDAAAPVAGAILVGGDEGAGRVAQGRVQAGFGVAAAAAGQVVVGQVVGREDNPSIHVHVQPLVATVGAVHRPAAPVVPVAQAAPERAAVSHQFSPH